MRFSTLTIVVFVAHTSTLAIAAPIPFPEEVQELVARGEDSPPSSSSGTSGAAHWKQAASRIARLVPPSLVNLPVHNNAASSAQKIVGAVANAGPRENHGRLPARPTVPAKQTASSVINHWQKISSGASQRPGRVRSSANAALHSAVAAMKKTQASPVTAALQQFNKSKSREASPTRKGAPSAHKVYSPGRNALKAHKSVHKASSAGHSTKASHAHKASKGKAAAGPKAKEFASTKKASASPKKAKAPKLRKRDLEVDELD